MAIGIPLWMLNVRELGASLPGSFLEVSLNPDDNRDGWL